MLRNGFYNLGGAIVRIGIGFLTICALTRCIGVAEYGLWVLTLSAVNLVGLAEAGLSISTTVFLSRDLAARDRDSVSQTLTVSLGAMLVISLLAAAALIFAAGPLAQSFPNLTSEQRVTAELALRLGGMAVWAKLLQQVLVGVEQAHQQYGLINLINTAQIAGISAALIGVACFGGLADRLMICQAAGALLALMVHALVCWRLLRPMRPRPRWNGRHGREMAKFSLFTWLTSLGGALFVVADRPLVGWLLGTREVGIYAAVTSITAQINNLSALQIQPLLPTLSGQAREGCQDRTCAETPVRQAMAMNALVALGLGAALFILAPEVVALLLPREPMESVVLVLRISAVLFAAYSMSAVGYFMLLAVGAAEVTMIVQLISGAAAICLIGLGTKSLGLPGAALGAVGYALTLSMCPLALRRARLPLSLWFSSVKVPLLLFASIPLALVLQQFGARSLFLVVLGCAAACWLWAELGLARGSLWKGTSPTR